VSEAAFITGWNWVAVAAFLLAGLIATYWEVRGIFDHDEHLVDTISELWWQLRNRVGPARWGLSTLLAVFFVWLWWHFSFEGRHRRTPIVEETEIVVTDPEVPDA
jgi:hypothetical protein